MRIAALASIAICASDHALRAQDGLRPSREYQVILWTSDAVLAKRDKLPLYFQRLREMGATAGMVNGDADPSALVEAKLPYYVENIVNRGLCLKWNSRVADWDKWVTAWKSTRDEAGLVREYSLDDPAWRNDAREAMQRAVKRHVANAPLLYDIRDEVSTTISANPFDYDFGPAALEGFRAWLKSRYASLDALNAEWDTSFASWDDVKPFTTDRIKQRLASGEAMSRGKIDWSDVEDVHLDASKPLAPPTRWSFAPWCDHRTYMDTSLAAVLDDLRRSAHSLDAKTPVGVAGTQMPSAFGGYDLWRLSRSVDWVEPYDVCGARAILGSFMPDKVFFTTVAEKDARAARRRLWHLLLEGDRGCFVWWSDDCIDVKSDDYTLTPRAKALAPVFAEMRSPLARLFLRARREIDPIAIHYSQASIQVAWLVDSAVDGSTWLRRFSSYEAEHSNHARVRLECLKRVEDAGYTPRFVSSEEIERGALKDFRRLVLPCSYALSDAEIAAVRGFGAAPKHGVDFASGALNGLFDEHGRLRATESRPFREETKGRALDAMSAEEWRKRVRDDVPLAVEVPASSEVKVHRYRVGAALLVALERNVGYQMGEDLAQRPVAQRLEAPIEIDVRFASAAHVYDLRNGRHLGFTDSVHVALDAWQPTLLALRARPLFDGDDRSTGESAGRSAADVVARLDEQADAVK